MSDIENEENSNLWTYLDSDGTYKGPFSSHDMDTMNQNGDLQRMVVIRVKCRGFEIELNDVDYGKADFFQKQKVIDKVDTQNLTQIDSDQKISNKSNSDQNKAKSKYQKPTGMVWNREGLSEVDEYQRLTRDSLHDNECKQNINDTDPRIKMLETQLQQQKQRGETLQQNVTQLVQKIKMMQEERDQTNTDRDKSLLELLSQQKQAKNKENLLEEQIIKQKSEIIKLQTELNVIRKQVQIQQNIIDKNKDTTDNNLPNSSLLLQKEYDKQSQYEIINTDLLKDVKNGIQYERTLSHAETQTDLSQSQPIDDKNQQKTLQRDRDDDKLQRHICVDTLALEWKIQLTAEYMQIYRINDQMSKFTCICILLYNSLIIYYFQI
ncbi:GYF-like_domain superfamily [Hexamita inflata]|uniref:GYF-like domain superfamily n=1 Tax=Hexamita inflata TaxID=28002 RepID=A0AA86QN26_9EUKA|nr:GYF-like domain superfamily [Hexamita inflata]